MLGATKVHAKALLQATPTSPILVQDIQLYVKASDHAHLKAGHPAKETRTVTFC